MSEEGRIYRYTAAISAGLLKKKLLALENLESSEKKLARDAVNALEKIEKAWGDLEKLRREVSEEVEPCQIGISQ